MVEGKGLLEVRENVENEVSRIYGVGEGGGDLELHGGS